MRFNRTEAEGNVGMGRRLDCFSLASADRDAYLATHDPVKMHLHLSSEMFHVMSELSLLVANGMKDNARDSRPALEKWRRSKTMHLLRAWHEVIQIPRLPDESTGMISRCIYQRYRVHASSAGDSSSSVRSEKDLAMKKILLLHSFNFVFNLNENTQTIAGEESGGGARKTRNWFALSRDEQRRCFSTDIDAGMAQVHGHGRRGVQHAEGDCRAQRRREHHG